MKIGKNAKYCVFIIAAALVCSCATVKSAWQPDAKTVEKEIKKTKKNGLMIFTASDSDERSKVLFKDVFGKAFFSKAGKKFSLYNIDIVRDESLMPPQQLERNYVLFADYNVLEVPYLVLMTDEGDVYHSALLPQEIVDTDSFLKYLDLLDERAETVKTLKSGIAKNRGPEKTQAIDRFFEKVYFVNSPKYKELFEEGIKSDPENKSGLVGKFILAKQSLIIDGLLAKKKYGEAVGEFMKALETKLLTPEEEQGVWCNIAYISSYADGSVKKDKIIDYLERALKAAPSSERAGDIRADIEFLKKQK